MISKVKMVSVIVIATNFKYLFTFIHMTSLLISKYNPSPPISMAVSTTSQLSVDIVATENISCDNVQSALTCSSMKQKLIIVHIRMIGAVTIPTCCSMALQWFHWVITAIPILLSYPLCLLRLDTLPLTKNKDISNAWICIHNPCYSSDYIWSNHYLSITQYKMAWAMRWGHGHIIACTIHQRMVWQKYFFWTMMIKYPYSYVLYQRILAWFYHRYGVYSKFLNLIIIEIFHFVALTI